jgi:hypothetical protein
MERRREDEMRNREKMNHGGEGDGFYTIIFPTELPTKIGIIFFLGSGIKFCWYLIDFRTKILKIPPDFSKPVGKSVGNCVSDHACIGFSASVGDSVVKHAD